jgi:hypothetical protein
MMSDKQKVHEERACRDAKCPLCAMSEMLKDCLGGHDDFFKHLKSAELEMLKAVRSLIDERIKDQEGQSKKTATKIKVS